MTAQVFLKRYLDEDEWEERTREQVERDLTSYYDDVPPVVSEILKGYVIATSFAIYKLKGEVDENCIGL